MKKSNQYLTLWAIGAAAVLAATALTAATYAWFTANREVETEKVTARTGSTNLELQISRKPGDQFSTKSETDEAGNTYTVAELKERDHVLMPVSTEDLKTFIYSPITDEGQATEQTLRILHSDVAAEKEIAEGLYYHDTLYLRLEGGGSMPEDAKADLYLDNLRDLPIVQAHENSKLLDAARLGLTIDDGTPLILRFTSDGENALSNTRLDENQLKTGLVLIEQNGGVAPSGSDPSHLLKDYQFSADNAIPTPLLTMKLGTIYKLDIYFYLEGCDPDCSGDVETDKADLALAFYAALQ